MRVQTRKQMSVGRTTAGLTATASAQEEPRNLRQTRPSPFLCVWTTTSRSTAASVAAFRRAPNQKRTDETTEIGISEGPESEAAETTEIAVHHDD